MSSRDIEAAFCCIYKHCISFLTKAAWLDIHGWFLPVNPWIRVVAIFSSNCFLNAISERSSLINRKQCAKNRCRSCLLHVSPFKSVDISVLNKNYTSISLFVKTHWIYDLWYVDKSSQVACLNNTPSPHGNIVNLAFDLASLSFIDMCFIKSQVFLFI